MILSAQNSSACKDTLGIRLSAPSKMPCRSFSISAFACNVGGKLAEVKGSVCFDCYARKGFYQMPNVKEALAKRQEQMESKEWAASMIARILLEEKSGFFRWFDSGDLASLKVLRNIVRIAIALPQIRFWLPTKEYRIVQQYRELYGAFPPNLNVRLSAYMVDKAGPNSLAEKLGVTTSEVSSEGKGDCPAPKQGNKCGDCRSCWDKNTQTVTYNLH